MTQCIDFQSRSSSLDMPTSAFSNIFIKDSLIDSTFLKFLWRFIFRFTDRESAIACFAIMYIYNQ